MKNQRGFVLLFAIVMLTVIVAAAALLAREAASRMGVRKAEFLREEALRSAESALEQARVELGAGTLRGGGTFSADQVQVVCTGIEGGVRLETIVALKAPAKSVPITRGVRVAWEFKESSGMEKWMRSAWSVRDETIRQ